MDDHRVTPSSGNIFADLGLPDAEELSAKAKILREVLRIIEDRKLTQTQAAKLLRVDQSDVSNLKHGRLRGFSLEKLATFLNRLDQDVDIVMRPKRTSEARIAVFELRDSDDARIDERKLVEIS